MPGGSVESYETLGPILESIAAVAEGEPCVTHVGTDGAGHFVKMIHNGIEYADMQLIAEAYDLLRTIGGLSPAQIADVFAEWNKGYLESYLIEITAEVLRQVDAETGKPFIDIVLDQAGSKGTGVWTVQNALDLGIPVGGIAEAVFARAVSSKPNAARGGAGDHPVASRGAEGVGRRRLRRRRVEGALRLEGRRLRAGLRRDHRGRREVRLGHQQGQDRQDLARRLHHPRAVPQPHRRRLRREPGHRDAAGGAVLRRRRPRGRGRLAPHRRDRCALRRAGARLRLGAVVLRLARAPKRLPAALVQGQRDFFGAHTYKRVDKEGVFHTLWSGDRTEIETEGSSH